METINHPRNAPLERLPEGTQSAYSAGADSGRHQLRRSPAPAERTWLAVRPGLAPFSVLWT